MQVFIITGASKGIGLALCKVLMDEDNILICVARTKNEELLQLAKEKKCHVIFYENNLADSKGIKNLMETMIDHLPEHINSATLINNAGVVDPIGRTEDNDPLVIMENIAINLTAPMILSSVFIKKLHNHPITKKIINISSGAGRKTYTSWSSYCASKSGLDHYTRVVSEEQKTNPFGVKIISIAPGIIDTGMQEKIRETNEKDFELVEQFIGYKKNGHLSSPEETASKLVQMIESETFNDLDAIVDLRNF
ncbi:(S)-benzoin forming benzil reductase [Bacillus sp. FSL K6-3431]|uniref:(S)-benzoin forming benzil reductase n=1 Tax=Bacillus sp. FSL K6-3431 TaxID=2921500 RepID=UPI0030F6B105